MWPFVAGWSQDFLTVTELTAVWCRDTCVNFTIANLDAGSNMEHEQIYSADVCLLSGQSPLLQMPA